MFCLSPYLTLIFLNYKAATAFLLILFFLGEMGHCACWEMKALFLGCGGVFPKRCH